MPDNDPYGELHPNVSSALNYRFPSYGNDLLKALFGTTLSKVKIKANWDDDEQKLVIDVHARSVIGHSLLLGRYQVYEEKNQKNGKLEIILEEVDTVYDSKKATDYGRVIKRIPIENPDKKLVSKAPAGI